MFAEPIRMQVVPDSDIARLLEKAGDTPILLEKDGELYRLTKEDDIWRNYDPERTRNALRKSVGALSNQEREELQKDFSDA